jgi:hypothetical protein
MTRPSFLSQNLNSAWKNEDQNAYSYCEESGIGTEINQASMSPWSLQEASQGIALIRQLVSPC